MKTFKPYRFETNPQEKKFVDEFIKQCYDHGVPDRIVFGANHKGISPDYLSERERDIVLSAIQWLGSPVGQKFLNDCGFVKEKTRDEQ